MWLMLSSLIKTKAYSFQTAAHSLTHSLTLFSRTLFRCIRLRRDVQISLAFITSCPSTVSIFSLGASSWTPHRPVLKGVPSHPIKKTNFDCLYQPFCSVSHYPKLMTDLEILMRTLQFKIRLKLPDLCLHPQPDVLDRLGWPSGWYLPKLHGRNQCIPHRVWRRPLAQWDHRRRQLAVLDWSLQRSHWESRLQWGQKKCTYGGVAPSIRHRCLQGKRQKEKWKCQLIAVKS